MFKITKKSKISRARLGIIETKRGRIQTPFFMPDATYGQIKNLSAQDLIDLDLACLVVNTLHLYLRPGIKLIKSAGDLHDFTGFERPILSDSGGYQIYSLIHRGKANGKITDAGAIFRSPLDGRELKLTPELSIKIQFDLGVEMIVCLDDCPPNDFNEAQLKIAVKRTILWAKRCAQEYKKQIKLRGIKNNLPMLIAVIQGGNNLLLRKYCAEELLKIGFDGFGFGARHVDREGNFLGQVLKDTAGLIPEKKLRFGLGIGLPEDIVRAVQMGYDMFDCVIPTREGRHGRLFFQKNEIAKSPKKLNNFYEAINITNAKFAKESSPINPDSRLTELRKYSKAYLNYLFKIKEPQAFRLASLNNLEFYFKILRDIRSLIKTSHL